MKFQVGNWSLNVIDKILRIIRIWNHLIILEVMIDRHQDSYILIIIIIIFQLNYRRTSRYMIGIFSYWWTSIHNIHAWETSIFLQFLDIHTSFHTSQILLVFLFWSTLSFKDSEMIDSTFCRSLLKWSCGGEEIGDQTSYSSFWWR